MSSAQLTTIQDSLLYDPVIQHYLSYLDLIENVMDGTTLEVEAFGHLLNATLNPGDDVPPPSVRSRRKRRRLVKKQGEPAYRKWKNVSNAKTDRCTICGDNFEKNDWVMEGAAGQWYHRKELNQWVQQTHLAQVTDPNTGVNLDTFTPAKRCRRAVK